MRSDLMDAAVAALRAMPQRHLYEGRDRMWHVSHGGPANLTWEEVRALEDLGDIKLDYPGFYKLGDVPVKDSPEGKR